ncbi:hypothetical protein CCYA_CCYA20G4839 [Cyanidiococcus yangmingshanensis]|nr:hypothetical protein CCYA_CCYA20G4839 [Cyanidiococcus yangmingshanensis]
MRGRASGVAANRLPRDDARAAAWDILASRGCVRSDADDDAKNNFDDDAILYDSDDIFFDGDDDDNDTIFYDSDDIFVDDDDDNDTILYDSDDIFFDGDDDAFVPWGASSFQHAAIGLPVSSHVMQCCASCD